MTFALNHSVNLVFGSLKATESSPFCVIYEVVNMRVAVCNVKSKNAPRSL